MNNRTPMEVYRCDEEFDIVQIQTKAGHISVSVAENGEVTIGTDGVDLGKVRILDEYGDSWSIHGWHPIDK